MDSNFSSIVKQITSCNKVCDDNKVCKELCGHIKLEQWNILLKELIDILMNNKKDLNVFKKFETILIHSVKPDISSYGSTIGDLINSALKNWALCIEETHFYKELKNEK